MVPTGVSPASKNTGVEEEYTASGSTLAHVSRIRVFRRYLSEAGFSESAVVRILNAATEAELVVAVQPSE